MLFIFLTFSLFNIPFKYNDLVKEAQKSTELKVPKDDREDTKFPGIYEEEKYHFKLTKILSSARTKDIKGFAYDEHNCAIVKRKTFNISNEFAFIDTKTQKIFLLKETVASDGNVIVFKSKEISIFHIMTDFHFESSTDKEIDHLQIKPKYRSKPPKEEIEYNHNWDQNRDRPKLKKIIKGSDIQAGIGQQFKFSVTASMSFNSAWDVSISFRAEIEGKLGFEILVPDGSLIKQVEINLKNKSIPIPNLSFKSKFLGLDISLSAFMNIDAKITDIEIDIPLGFDYLKVYQLIATKYYEINPNTVSDSTWEINLNQIPEEDTIRETIKSVQSSAFTATFQMSPYFTFEFVVGSLNSILECGIKFPFVCTFGFDKESCKFPHMRGNFEIPLEMYYDFSGLKSNDYVIIERKSDDFVFNTISSPNFCIDTKRIINDEVDKSSKIIGYYIENDDIYEEKENGLVSQNKQIIVGLYDKQNEPIAMYMYPFKYYEEKTKKDRLIFLYSSAELQNEFKWSINYCYFDVVKSGDTFSKKIADLNFDKKDETTFPVEIQTRKGNNSDVTHLTATIKRVPLYYESQVYFRDFEYATLYSNGPLNANYTLLVIDQDGNRKIDKDCIIKPSSFLDKQFQIKGDVKPKGFPIKYKINSSVINEDNVRVLFHLVVNFKLVSSFVTPVLRENQNYRQEEYVFPTLYIKSGTDIYLSGSIFRSDDSEEPFLSNDYYYDEENTCFTFDVGFNIKFEICFEPFNSLFLVKTSYTNPYPLAEVFLQTININDFSFVNDAFKYIATFKVTNQEKYKILHFDIPKEYHDCSLYITIPKTNYCISFFDDKVLLLDDFHGLIEINQNKIIDILIAIESGIENVQIEYFYAKTQKKSLIISPNGSTFKLIPNVFNTMMIPLYYGLMEYKFYFNSVDEVSVARTTHVFGDYVFTTFFTDENKKIDCTIYLIATVIGDQEPSVTVDLSNYQPLITQSGNFSYYIHSKNGVKILCEMNDKFMTSDIIDNRSEFIITDVSKPITFTKICRNSNEKACLIEYPAPSTSGFHLIKYPNRDGISITGRGFLVEAIYVEEGKSFTYSKTYEGMIEKIREYSDDPIEIKLKVIDKNDTDYMGMKNLRKICLIDSSNNTVPFSRKFFNEKLNEFLNRLGISEDIDYNMLINDENGCIVFDSKYIVPNDFNNLTNSFCNLNVKGRITKVYEKESIFNNGRDNDCNHPHKNKKKMIIIIVAVVAVAVVIVFIIIILILVVKRKKVSNKENPSEDEKIEDNNNISQVTATSD